MVLKVTMTSSPKKASTTYSKIFHSLVSPKGGWYAISIGSKKQIITARIRIKMSHQNFKGSLHRIMKRAINKITNLNLRRWSESIRPKHAWDRAVTLVNGVNLFVRFISHYSHSSSISLKNREFFFLSSFFQSSICSIICSCSAFFSSVSSCSSYFAFKISSMAFFVLLIV